VFALDLVGQGCGAAIPNLRAAGALLRSDDCTKVLSICVEVCSAAFYLDNDPGVLISACLFGDGDGAAVLAAEPAPVGRTGGGDDRQPCWQHAGLRVNKAAGTLAMFSKRSFRAWSRPMRRTLDGAEHRPRVEPSG
jgi:3-oxoacyl-[acyl-carrier-protein] synthase III